MARRNYKRDRKGRFARFGGGGKSTRSKARSKKKKARDKELQSIFAVSRRRDGNYNAQSLYQRRSVKRHIYTGAAVGSVVPGVGTLLGGAAGAIVGSSRKKNKPIVLRRG